ncbi:MAG: DUF1580 domain-containing protein [Planctomycetaceae bacterium]|nr:DUF1580 domain-containing protein [Planctomycetaceae bacterium]
MIASLSQDDRTQVDPHIALDDACHCFPGRPHRATLWRWALHGVSRNGERIRLRTVVSGSRRYTQTAWCEEFLRALNADNPTQQPAPGAARVRRQRQAAAAMTALQSR